MKDQADVTEDALAERRKTKRERHVDRRQSDMDVIAHVVRGAQTS
jgi:hypothetical protein